MANHKSAEKQYRQSLKKRARNRLHRARMRTAVKRLRNAVSTGEADTARELLRPTLAVVDRTTKLGAIHDNAAARTKSRLTRAVNALAS